MKICSICKIEKENSDFHKRKDNKSGLAAACRQCDRKRRNKFAESDPNAEHRWKLKALYGIDLEQYKAMLAAQGGKCAICGTSDPGKNKKHWSVDHDHATGAVRQLLCSGCNLGIGHLKDSVDLLQKAIAYLEFHRNKNEHHTLQSPEARS